MRKLPNHKLLFLCGWLLSVALSGCATFSPNYSGADIRDQIVSKPAKESVHTLFFAGGFGEARDTSAAKLLSRHLESAPAASTLLVLGNFIHPKANPSSPQGESAGVSQQLDSFVNLMSPFPGKTYFLPGYLEWQRRGLKGLQEITSYLETRSGGRVRMMPSAGCAGPEKVELTPSVNLLLVDSQWWLENWSRQIGINEGCYIGNREVYSDFLRERLKSLDFGITLVAMHHSLFSEGWYGGVYAPIDHLFPLRTVDPKLWIPLPILGSLPPFYRYTVGTRQDIAHPRYRAFRRSTLTAARQSGQFIFLSAHEQVMHYLERQDQQFIIAGSGGKAQATRLGKGGVFAAGRMGFGKLIFYEGGSAWLEFWETAPDSARGRLLFRQIIREADPDMEIIDSLGLEPSDRSLEWPLSQRDFQREGFGRKLWGENYRAANNAKEEMPLLWLSELEEQLRPVRASSDYTTQNLELLSMRGRAFELRSLEREAKRVLPYPFNDSVLRRVIEDNFSAIHPMASLPLPYLQKAAGIPHTRPQLFFLPQQKALGSFNRDYSDQLYLLEEDPAQNQLTSRDYPDTSAYLTTRELIRQLIRNPRHSVDESALIRARLFDLLIGDLDRGFEKWYWRQETSPEGIEYTPLGRMHDLAFSRYDGFLAWLGKLLFPQAYVPGSYDADKIPSISKLTYPSRFLDRGLLNEAGPEVWEKQARHLQASLTDSVLQFAFRNAWPKRLYELDGERLISSLQNRRNKLGELAREFYRHLAQQVNVLGSQKSDWFRVERLPGKRVRVQLSEDSTYREEHILYDRTFQKKETRSVILYGMGGEDHFQVVGKNQGGMKVRMIGGPGKDTFRDRSRGLYWIPKNLFYDARSEEREVEAGPGTGTRFTKDPRMTTFNPIAVDQDNPVLRILPKFSINPDDGLVIGLGASLTTFGFKKRPFETRQELAVFWGTFTNGFAAEYQGEANRALGPFSLVLDARYQTPLYTINFYGFGNETVNQEDELGRGFNRVRQNLIRVVPALKLNLKSNSYFSAGLRYEQIRIDRVPNRIFSDSLPAGVDSSLFSWQRFVGPVLAFEFQNLDNPAFPSRGIDIRAEVGTIYRLTVRKQTVLYAKAELSTYLGLNRKEDLVLAGRAGFHHLFTADFEFYQAANIGGSGENATTRGFRRNRFTGQTAAYGNGELRWRFLQSQNRSFPFSLGAYAGLDVGRVWLEGERSSTWHHGLGGGIFFSPLDLFTGVFDVFYGDRERLTVFADFKFYF